MKKIFTLLFSLCTVFALNAQEQTPQETARGFMRTGDFDNAILVLKKALQNDANSLDLQKDLAMSYLYKRDFASALNVVKPMLERDDADVVTYQIGGNVYKALEMVKDADKMYRKALKKFPSSGPLYSEYGELLWDKKNYDAIEQWEKGIEVDPSYAGNYYNAASYYYFTKDKIWTLIYGEIFVNMEYLTERATEVKRMLLSTYKEKLFSDVDNKDQKNDFARAVYQTYNKQSSLTAHGITMESLNMIRTRFILDWYYTYASKFPFKLFDYQQQLLREGMFEAYNAWLFGPVDNLSGFDQWTRSNAEAYAKFTSFQKGRVFKVPAGQHYK
ncbi:MAG: tetratricopeptide repeat protein [Flavisolibacter sp.]|jgi:Tfp pilus assembly protein PilF